jgi:hypothetical protein
MMKLFNHDVAFVVVVNHNVAFVAKPQILNVKMMNLFTHDVAFVVVINQNVVFIAKQQVLNSFLNVVYIYKAVAKPPRFLKLRRFFFMLKNIGLDEKQLQGDSFKATTRISFAELRFVIKSNYKD